MTYRSTNDTQGTVSTQEAVEMTHEAPVLTHEANIGHRWQ